MLKSPVKVVKVGPERGVQLNVSLVSWTQPQDPDSKLQFISFAAGVVVGLVVVEVVVDVVVGVVVVVVVTAASLGVTISNIK